MKDIRLTEEQYRVLILALDYASDMVNEITGKELQIINDLIEEINRQGQDQIDDDFIKEHARKVADIRADPSHRPNTIDVEDRVTWQRD